MTITNTVLLVQVYHYCIGYKLVETSVVLLIVWKGESQEGKLISVVVFHVCCVCDVSNV